MAGGVTVNEAAEPVVVEFDFVCVIVQVWVFLVFKLAEKVRYSKLDAIFDSTPKETCVFTEKADPV